MSETTNNEYSLIIKLNDSDLKKKLEQISKAGENLAEPLEKVIEKFEARKSKFTDKSWLDVARNKVDNLKEKMGGGKIKGFIENIDKSTIGILAGITTVVGLITTIVASSEYLQKMFDLIQTGIMLIFRPIGDFIAAFLKPIILYFYRYFIIPYIKQVLPIMLKLGDWLGNQVVTTGVDNLNANANYLYDSEMGKALREFLEDLLASQTAHADTGDTAETKKKKKKWNDHIDDFFKWIEDGFSKFADDLTRAWDGFVDWLTPHLRGIRNKLEKYWGIAVDWFTNVSRDIGNALHTAWVATTNWFLNVSETIKQRLTTAWNATVNWFLNVRDTVVKNLTDAWDATVKTISNLADYIKTNLSKGWNIIVSTVSSIANSAKTTLVKFWNGLLEAVSAVVSSARTTLVKLWNGLVEAFGSIVGSARSTLITLWNHVVKVFSGIAESAGSTLVTIWNNITKVFSFLHETITNNVVAAWKTVVGWFGALAKSAEEILGPTWSKIMGISEAIAKRLESGAKSIVTILQSTIDHMTKSFGGIFNGIIQAFNNFASKVNSATGGIDTSRDDRDSDRNPSPDTGTDDKGPTDSKGGAGDAKGDKGGDPSGDTGGKSDASHTIQDNSKRGWYLYKGTRYLGVIQYEKISTGSSSSYWVYADKNGTLQATTTTAGYTARKNRLSDGYDTKPPPDITDPNNDDTGSGDQTPPYDSKPPPDTQDPNNDDTTGGSAGSKVTAKQDYSKKGWYVYKGKKYLGIVDHISTIDNKVVYRDAKGRLNTAYNTGLTYSKTKKPEYDSAPPPDTQDPNNDDTGGGSGGGSGGSDGSSGGSGGKTKPKKPAGWTDAFYESVYGFPPPDETSQVQSKTYRSAGSDKGSQVMGKMLKVLEKISVNTGKKNEKDIHITVTGKETDVDTKIQEDTRRGSFGA